MPGTLPHDHSFDAHTDFGCPPNPEPMILARLMNNYFISDNERRRVGDGGQARVEEEVVGRSADLPAGQSRRPYVKVTTHWV